MVGLLFKTKTLKYCHYFWLKLVKIVIIMQVTVKMLKGPECAVQVNIWELVHKCDNLKLECVNIIL